MLDFSAFTVKQIKEKTDSAAFEEYPLLINALYADSRESVKKIALDLFKKQDKYNKEVLRIENLRRMEFSYYDKGYQFVAGGDEAGRGPLCGPVVSAVVIMPKDSSILYINDSKKISEKMRNELYEKITSQAVSYSVGIIDNDKIDEINILQATKLAMLKALENMDQKPDMLMLDALTVKSAVPQKSFVKGDANHYVIAAASIIAKVTRDKIMYEYDEKYPEYGFAQNKGYGTESHMAALEKYGPTPIHRKTFLSGTIKHTSVNIGRKYEDTACEYLKNKNYEIITTNYKRDNGEIDIVAGYEDRIIFIEVKARSASSFGTPEECVTIEKQKRVVKTANRFILERAVFSDVRFDIIAIDIQADGHCNIRHYENAFTAD